MHWYPDSDNFEKKLGIIYIIGHVSWMSNEHALHGYWL